MIQISNQHLIVTMTQEGGTLTSIRDAKTGREYLWQGDPAYWTGQAPNLFPFVGRLYPQEFPLMQALHDKDGDHIFALPILAEDSHGIGGIGAAHRQ